MKKAKSDIWHPHDYQKVGIKWLVAKPEALLFLEPGMGKTAITLTAFKALKKARGARRMLIIAPMRVCHLVWTHDAGGELDKWANFDDLTVGLLHGPEKDSVIEKPFDIYVVNPAGLDWLTRSGGLMKLFKHGVDVLAIDELSAFKHSRTKRFKLMKPYLPRFRRRWGLTGSPSANGLIDLFGQVYMIDLGKRLGRYITHYRHNYFVPQGFGGFKWVPQKDGEARIFKVLSDIALSMKATDHLDLPELVERNIWVVLPQNVQQSYDKLEEDLITTVEASMSRNSNGVVVTAANVAVALGKCRQVASGGLYVMSPQDSLASLNGDVHDVPPKQKTLHLHNAKTEALVELIDELQGSPLLVGFEFRHDLDRIREALGDVPAIYGGVSTKVTVDLVKRWNAGELPVLAGHPAAMGHGLNLQACGHHICWYSLTWNYELYDQFIRRIWRQGQKNHVFVHRILARNTVDVTIATLLESKKRGQNALLEALKKRAKHR